MPEQGEKTVDLMDPTVPGLIREAVIPIWDEGFSLVEVDCESGVEWWLLDASGDLIDAFWLK